MKKRVALFLTFVFVLSMALSGCGKAPKTAADVLKMNAENDSSNYSMDGTYNITMGMETMGMNISVPITMNLNSDIADNNSHGTMDLTMDMGALGGENKLSAEIYVEQDGDNVTVYSREKDGGTWNIAGDDSQKFVKMGTSILDGINFDNAEFKHDSQAKTYVVTQKFSELLSNERMDESLGAFFEVFKNLGVDEASTQEIIDALGESDVIYTFDDKDCTLLSVKASDMNYSFSTENYGLELKVDVSMGMDFNYSNYGKIKAEDVAVPADVKAEAE